MASDESRKRKRSAASESGPSLVSEDLMLRIDALDMSSQHDATSETLFKKPRRSIIKKTYLLEPLLLRSWSIMTKAISRVTNGWI